MARPPKYTPEELEKKIDEYFQDRIDPRKKMNFVSIVDLCYFLGIDRATFYRYRERPGYATVTKKAEQAIITIWERQLFSPGRNTTGAIFWLKNFGGMADRVEHQHTGQIQHQHTASMRLDQIPDDTLLLLTRALEALEEKERAIDVTPGETAGETEEK